MPPPRKRVKTSAVEEVVFDPAAREEYLTGFHKRKVARTKAAQELNAKKEREEKIEERRKLREERKADLEKHVADMNAIMKQQNPDLQADSDEDESEEDADAGGEWNGFAEDVVVNHEDEYIDEDKYTTVTVAAVDITRDGMVDPDTASDEENDGKPAAESKTNGEGSTNSKKRVWTKEKPAKGKPKVKKQKFRYESKADRKVTRQKERSKGRSQASARRA